MKLYSVRAVRKKGPWIPEALFVSDAFIISVQGRRQDTALLEYTSDQQQKAENDHGNTNWGCKQSDGENSSDNH